MNYLRSIPGALSSSVTNTWNSINPATLSGAIDVIVVEREDGTLACSPFHVRFGKFQLLQPFNKKVEFKVNHVKRDYPMKVGEGGEAFFVFETTDSIPSDMQTSPLVSPVASPQTVAKDVIGPVGLGEVEPLDLEGSDKDKTALAGLAAAIERPKSAEGTLDLHSASADFEPFRRPKSTEFRPNPAPPAEDLVVPQPFIHDPATTPPSEAYNRAVLLSKRLWTSKISSTVSPLGDLMLDMTSYKSDEASSLRAEVIARKVLSEEVEGNMDIGSLIGADEHGNIWIYASLEAKEEADRKSTSLRALNPVAMRSQDAISDPGYHSDDNQSDEELSGLKPPSSKGLAVVGRRDSDSAVGLSAPGSPDASQRRESAGHLDSVDPVVKSLNFAKTLRLTHDQLKSLDLQPGPNTMSFTVNKASCAGFIYYWKHDVPIVISDIDGTITKSDALGHVLNMIGRDWTHVGVAKLYTDIVANGYHILYLTSRSVGQADTTRGYLNGVVQDGYKLPKGPVIMSPDRTMAALRREVYLRKPEVFKMACLRDIMNLFQTYPSGGPQPAAVENQTSTALFAAPTSPTAASHADAASSQHHQRTPFTAGFGNRLTDALSYRSVSIPPTRIFTINSNAEVSLYLLTLNTFRISYVSIWELVDHYFPPVGLLVKEGGEEYTDFNYWREGVLDVDQFSASESDESGEEDVDEGEEYDDEEEEEAEYEEDMEGSFMSRDSLDGEVYDGGVGENVLLEPVEEMEEYEGEDLDVVAQDNEAGPEEQPVLLVGATSQPVKDHADALQTTPPKSIERVSAETSPIPPYHAKDIKAEDSSTQENMSRNGIATVQPSQPESKAHSAFPPASEPEEDIFVAESRRLEALSLEADEEVVHAASPTLERANTVPE